jgi:hypothetical protein
LRFELWVEDLARAFRSNNGQRGIVEQPDLFEVAVRHFFFRGLQLLIKNKTRRKTAGGFSEFGPKLNY